MAKHGVAAISVDEELCDRPSSSPLYGEGGTIGPSSGSNFLLSSPEDSTFFSESVCLLRAQIEVFAAKPEDVIARSRRGGLKDPIRLGRVGIRCVHCNNIPHESRATGAVSYPVSIRLFHQAFRNWKRYHFPSCKYLPAEVRKRIEDLESGSKRQYSISKKGSTKDFWCTHLQQMGLVDAEDGNGIHFMAENDTESDGGTGNDSVGSGTAGENRLQHIRFNEREEIRTTDKEQSQALQNCAERSKTSTNESIDAIGIVQGLITGSETSGIDLGAGRALEEHATSASAPPAQFDCANLSSSGGGDTRTSNNIGHSKPASVTGIRGHDLGSSATDLQEVTITQKCSQSKGNVVFPVTKEACDSPEVSAPVKLDGDFECMESMERLAGNQVDMTQESFTNIAEEDFGHDHPSHEEESLHSVSQAEDIARVNTESREVDVPASAHIEMTDEKKTGRDERRDEIYNHGDVQRSSNAATSQNVIQDAKQDAYQRLLSKVQLAHNLVKASRDLCTVPESNLTVHGADCSKNHSTSSIAQTEPNKQDNLFYLGLELYELFAGCQPFSDGDMNNASVPGTDLNSTAVSAPVPQKKKRAANGGYTPLRELGFPMSLCNLVSSLLDTGNNEGDVKNLQRYQSADEVESELHLMTVDPDRYLFGARADTFAERLDFSHNKIYGREEQIGQLMNACNRVVGAEGTSEIVIVSGYSGTGKSSLVQLARRPFIEKGGYYIERKFDELRIQPLSVVFAAFNDFCDVLLKGDISNLTRIRAAIVDAVGSDGKVLTDFIPNLHEIIGKPSETTVTVNGKEAQNRLIFFFRKFLRAISSPEHPFCLFLDDLQWADGATLDFLRMLVTGSQTTSFLFIGCYRDNEVKAEHPLMKTLASIVSSGVRINRIVVDNMSREAVNTLVSDALHLSPLQIRSLTDLVYNKTSGNALFVVQFLMSLYSEGLVHYSLASRQWQWDVDAIRSKNIADNVVELMTFKMLKLDPKVIWGLNKAACLGHQCDESTLNLLDTQNCPDHERTAHQLDIAVWEGLMSKVGSTFKFSHDQIQHAAYSMIPSDKVDAFHLQIGRLLWRNASEEELDRILNIAVDQLQRGQGLINDQMEKNELAHLFLRAGKKAIASAAFPSASVHLLQGIRLLDESHWKTHYDLSLQLFSCCAEVQSVQGNMVDLQVVAGPIFEQGKSLEDKLRAYFALITMLANQGKHLDAIRYGLDVLAQLGEHFPSDPNQDSIFKDFAKTRAMLESFGFDGISQKQMMEASEKMSAMKLLSTLTVSTFQANQSLSPLVTFRMVQLSLNHGLCKESPLAFAAFGAFFINLNDFDQAYRYGKLASSLLERINSKEQAPQVCATFQYVAAYKEPIQAILPPTQHAFELAMSVGNIDWAIHNATNYVVLAMQCGIKLEQLLKTSTTFLDTIKEYKHAHSDLVASTLSQAVLNLMGSSEDPTVLTGYVMKEDELLASALEDEDRIAMCIFYSTRMWLAYLFNRYSVAAEMADCYENVSKLLPFRGARVICETFYAGLVAVSVEMSSLSQCNIHHSGEQSKWVKLACDSRDKMKVWAEASAWNCQHKLDLLSAEIAHLNSDLSEAGKLYTDAIRNAKEHGFQHELALACERAGMFYSKTVSEEVGLKYFLEAHNNYLQWGAIRKADYLIEQYGLGDGIK